MPSILVLNAGSSSLKFSLFENGNQTDVGEIEEIGTENSITTCNGKKRKIACHSFGDGVAILSDVLQEIERTLSGIGYRIVFGGDVFTVPTHIDDAVLHTLDTFSLFAPLHMPQEIALIREMRKRFPNIPHIGCFDTSFHRTIPAKASHFPLPKKIREKGVVRYGFHGLSYEYISKQKEVAGKKVIAAHLGSGCSLCAMEKGKSLDTSMGFTPLGGIPMCTRPGDLDPGILFFLLRQGMSLDVLEQVCEKESGLLGLSGKSKDMKILLEDSSEESLLAIELFCYEVAKGIGSYCASLGGIDTLIFTAGIGERAPKVREEICKYLSFLGLELDEEKNRANARVISSPKSAIEVCVIPTNEEAVIAGHVSTILSE